MAPLFVDAARDCRAHVVGDMSCFRDNYLDEDYITEPECIV